MLNDRKQIGVWGRPFPSGGGAINHYRDEPNGRKGWGMGFGPPRGESHESLEWYRDEEVLPGVVAWEFQGPPQWDPPWPGEQRVLGCPRLPFPWGLNQAGLWR